MATSLEHKRHSLAHLLAAALKELHPDVKLAIGPAIDTGFYYDIELAQPLTPEDLPILQKRMRALAAQKLTFERSESPVDEALARMNAEGQPYKAEIVEDLKKEGETSVSFYTTGSFVDLCRGGHVEDTSEIAPDAFLLDRLAGAYWRGDEKRPMLQRVYGLAFDTRAELDAFLAKREEAEKRDHRKIGPALNLFRISQEVGPGLPIILKDGMVVWHALELHLREMMRKYYRGNVHELHTAHIGSQKLYETSGHWEKYKDDNFPPMKLDDRSYILKPMNCPHHIQAYTHKPLSYRDLPFRTFEIGTTYRLEQSGELSGLTRVRSLSVDDGHLFVQDDEDQIREEMRCLINIIVETYQRLGLGQFRIRLSTRDAKHAEKYVGEAQQWDMAEQALRSTLFQDFHHLLEDGAFEEAPGEAAFYGPKIDFLVTDALGREWQLSTIQLDYNLPKRFDLSYVDAAGKKRQPVMIHRAIFGSMERFLGVYIEHTAGAFPTWLAPVQVSLLPVNDTMVAFAQEIETKLFDANVRVELDASSESVGKKIRAAVERKVPYMIVLGEREQASGELPVRARGSREAVSMTYDAFLAKLMAEDSSIRP